MVLVSLHQAWHQTLINLPSPHIPLLVSHEAGFHVCQASLKFSLLPRTELLIFMPLPPKYWYCRMYDHPWLCNAGAQSRGVKHGRCKLSQLNYTSSPFHFYYRQLLGFLIYDPHISVKTSRPYGKKILNSEKTVGVRRGRKPTYDPQPVKRHGGLYVTILCEKGHYDPTYTDLVNHLPSSTHKV